MVHDARCHHYLQELRQASGLALPDAQVASVMILSFPRDAPTLQAVAPSLRALAARAVAASAHHVCQGELPLVPPIVRLDLSGDRLVESGRSVPGLALGLAGRAVSHYIDSPVETTAPDTPSAAEACAGSGRAAFRMEHELLLAQHAQYGDTSGGVYTF